MLRGQGRRASRLILYVVATPLLAAAEAGSARADQQVAWAWACLSRATSPYHPLAK